MHEQNVWWCERVLARGELDRQFRRANRLAVSRCSESRRDKAHNDTFVALGGRCIIGTWRLGEKVSDGRDKYWVLEQPSIVVETKLIYFLKSEIRRKSCGGRKHQSP